jgi:hypothetical protein
MAVKEVARIYLRSENKINQIVDLWSFLRALGLFPDESSAGINTFLRGPAEFN